MIEKLVTSLDVSRKLKDLGVIQESYFYWVKCSDTRNFIIIPSYAVYLRSDSFKETISAFTVTELGAMYGRDGQELLCPIQMMRRTT